MGNKADIIFVSFPAYLYPISIILKKFGHNVFYIRLSDSEYPLELDNQRALTLREAGIVPLPLEQLPHFDGVRKNFNDPEKKLEREIDQFVPMTLLNAFKALYPNNTNILNKLRTVVQTMTTGQITTVAQVNLWARVHQGRKHLLVYPTVSGLLAFDLALNVRLLVVPMDLFLKGVSAVTRIFRVVLRAIMTTLTHKKNHSVTAASDLENMRASRVVFVTHAGLNYGNLFQKTLFYSERTDSELHPDNLLHFDYSGTPSPSQKTRWVCLGKQPKSFLLNLYHALVAISSAIIRIRHVREVIGVMLLTKFYVSYKFYTKVLEGYPNLKTALIDYDILCPKALLLAFEARNIKSVAAQERFIAPFYIMYGAIVNTYLCGSDYIAGIMKKLSSYYVDHYLPAGQYRSDNLTIARQSPPPQILKEPIAQGRRIITALGFHTHLNWYNSQSDPLLNWTAHRHFLYDMIRLSQDIPNVFIILRFKLIDWVSLEVFADVIREIESSENITVSLDYEKSFFSYDLCAHSHLVIAKHSSLGDECLSVGIPVLFHEYTHNTERLVADVFDYSPTRIMCFNYEELLERSKAVLMGDSTMASDYEYLKSVVYGGLGDGKVRERIHGHIESMML